MQACFFGVWCANSFLSMVARSVRSKVFEACSFFCSSHFRAFRWILQLVSTLIPLHRPAETAHDVAWNHSSLIWCCIGPHWRCGALLLSAMKSSHAALHRKWCDSWNVCGRPTSCAASLVSVFLQRDGSPTCFRSDITLQHRSRAFALQQTFWSTSQPVLFSSTLWFLSNNLASPEPVVFITTFSRRWVSIS